MNYPMNPMGQMGIAPQQAYGLSSLGRGDDSMLVHMTPHEVQGLQSLAMAHGGSLTTNPNTGLPEAGFLSSILPTLIGVGLAPFTGGASLLANPWVVGGVAGLGAMLATGGSWKDRLSAAAKWGLGVGGGASFGKGLQNLVPPVPSPSAVPVAGAAVIPVAEAAVTPGQGLAAMGKGFGQITRGEWADFAGPFGIKGGPGVVASLGPPLVSAALDPPDPLDVPKYPGDDDYAPGGKYAYEGPYLPVPPPHLSGATPEEFEEGVEHSYFGEGYGGYPQVRNARGGGLLAGGGTVSGERMYFPPSHFVYSPKPDPNYSYGAAPVSPPPRWKLPLGGPGVLNYVPHSLGRGTTPPVATSPGTMPPRAPNRGDSDSGEQMYFPPSYFSNGGSRKTTSPYLTGAIAWPNLPLATQKALQSFGIYPPDSVTTPPVTTLPRARNREYSDSGEQMYFPPSYFKFNGGAIETTPSANPAFAGPPRGLGVAYKTSGGVTDLPTSSPGGMLRGRGDGMSDSIPARIDGKQEARLATGEFVIPADVVSHFGNGASDAGAKVLYEMMDRVRHARTGNSKQGKKIKPGRFLPA